MGNKFALLCISLCIHGCLSADAPDQQSFAPTVHIALENEFADFLTWQSFEVGDEPLPAHGVGPRVAYVNRLPPSGAKHFPVGTIIVKTMQQVAGHPNGAQVHAMVKRGQNFNLDGALGWEWFELIDRNAGIGAPRWGIDWRGEEPRTGATYTCIVDTGAPIPDCNGCHMAAKENDYIKSPALQLTNF